MLFTHDSLPGKQFLFVPVAFVWLAPVCCILSYSISWSFPGVLQDKDLFSVFADPNMLDT